MKILSALFVAFMLAGFLAPLGFIACKAPQSVIAYKTLAAVEATVDEARQAFVSEYQAGRISDITRLEVLKLDAKFHSAYLVAISAAGSAQSPSPASVTQAANEFISLVYTLIRK